jgi:hypothetical protein
MERPLPQPCSQRVNIAKEEMVIRDQQAIRMPLTCLLPD